MPTQTEQPTNLLDLRRRDHERAARQQVQCFEIGWRGSGRFAVPSQSQGFVAHEVAFSDGVVACDDGCEGFRRRGTCLHRAAVERLLVIQGRMADPFEDSEPVRDLAAERVRLRGALAMARLYDSEDRDELERQWAAMEAGR